MNTDCFPAYLNEFFPTYPNDLHIIPTDNAICHTAKRLVIPANVILGFQPAHSPDCNPIEPFWAWVKGKIAWNLFEDLEHLKQTVSLQLNSISHSFLSSITGKERLIADLAIVNNQILYTDSFY